MSRDLSTFDENLATFRRKAREAGCLGVWAACIANLARIKPDRHATMDNGGRENLVHCWPDADFAPICVTRRELGANNDENAFAPSESNRGSHIRLPTCTMMGWQTGMV